MIRGWWLDRDSSQGEFSHFKPNQCGQLPTEFQKTHQKAKVTYMAQLIVTKNAVAILLRLSITPPPFFFYTILFCVISRFISFSSKFFISSFSRFGGIYHSASLVIYWCVCVDICTTKLKEHEPFHCFPFNQQKQKHYWRFRSLILEKKKFFFLI